MNASDIIKRLESLIDSYGDFECKVSIPIESLPETELKDVSYVYFNGVKDIIIIE